MKTVICILWGLVALLIGQEIFFTALRKKVCFRCIRSDSLPEGFLKTICPQMEEVDLPVPNRAALESLSCNKDCFQEIAETADPNAPNQAVLYIEDSNIVLVSMGVAVRIARGDKRLARKVARWTESFESAFVIIANFGFFEYNSI